MPATLQTPKGTRCIRCATLIRNSRKTCPSCDLDLTGSDNTASKSKVASRVGSAINPAAKSKAAAGDSGRTKARAARASMKLCPVCMSSVNESEMSESAGQMVCNTCAVKLKNKPPRPANGAPGVVATPSASAPAPVVSKSEPEARPVAGGGLPAKPIMSDDELLTAKGMQRQLMDKLVWIKVLVIIWGVVNILFGGLAYVGGALGGALVTAVEEHASDDMLKDDDFVDDDGNKMSAEKIKAERERIRETAVKVRDEARSAIFKVKLIGALSILIGVSFIVAFFMMKHKPFEVCTIILVLYVLSHIVGIALVGFEHYGLLDIFITISVLSTLVTGIRTGMRIKDIRDRAEAATGRPVIA